MNALMGYLSASFFQFLPVGILLFFMACIQKSLKPLIAAGLLLFFWFLDTIVLRAPYLLSFHHFTWNFEGKILEFLLPFVVVYGFRFLSPHAIGLKWPRRNVQFLWGLGLGILMAASFIVTAWCLNYLPLEKATGEDLLYEFTLPGLAEELFIRGLLLALLDKYLGVQRNVFNFYSGWGIILVSILFVLWHTIVYDSAQNAVIWSADLGTLFLIAGSFVLGFLRIKTNSIWPGVLCHNCMNGLYFLALYLIR